MEYKQKKKVAKAGGHRCKLYQPIKTNVNNQWVTAVRMELVFRWFLHPYMLKMSNSPQKLDQFWNLLPQTYKKI